MWGGRKWGLSNPPAVTARIRQRANDPIQRRHREYPILPKNLMLCWLTHSPTLAAVYSQALDRENTWKVNEIQPIGSLLAAVQGTRDHDHCRISQEPSTPPELRASLAQFSETMRSPACQYGRLAAGWDWLAVALP